MHTPLEERICQLCHLGVESEENYVYQYTVFYEIKGKYHCHTAYQQRTTTNFFSPITPHSTSQSRANISGLPIRTFQRR